MDEIKEIDKICKKYKIKNYVINKDGSVDVNGNVDLFKKNLKFLPLKFNVVNGNCDFGVNFLNSLKNSPVYVGGEFRCWHNKLTSLKYSPIETNGDFDCSNNELTSLEYGPEHVYGKYICSFNKLKNLKGCAKRIKGHLLINNNLDLYTFEGLMYCEPKRISCENTIFYNVWRLFEDVSKIELFNDMDIIREDVNDKPVIILDRLNEFLDIIGKPRVKRVNGYINI